MKPHPSLALASVLLVTAPLALSAQERAARSGPSLKFGKFGKVTAVVQSSFLTPLLLHLIGSIRVTSEQYDLTAGDVKIYFPPKKGRSAGQPPLDRATADGGPGGQVDVHVRRPLESESYEILADHAVYVPDKAKPDYARMDFTGHVTVAGRSGFLVGPGVMTTDRAALLLGPGDDYPQLSTGPAHVTATPAE